MKFNLELFQKNVFCVGWNPESLSLLLSGPSDILKCETIFLQESSREGLSSKIAHFLKHSKPRETLLILPRSEILQKQIVFEYSKNQDAAKDMLESQLSQVLPYSPKEMAYGLMMENEAQSSKGLLYAITEKKMLDILAFTSSLGIEVDEVVSEDQTLCWNRCAESMNRSILMIDQTLDRVLFVVMRDLRILTSRTISKEKDDINSILSEAALCLLELGQKPSRVNYSGIWSVEDLESLRRQFPVEIEKLESHHVSGQSVSPSLSGATFFGKYPFTSLLPGSNKIRKWQLQQKLLLKGILAAFALFWGGCFLFGACHFLLLKNTTSKLNQEAQKLLLEIKTIKEMASSLDRVHKAEFSKRRVLETMKDLAERIPASIKLTELQVEDGDLVFRGESPSHAILSEAVQVFESCETLHTIKLEHTRLRKHLNQDYFEFEISAKWKN